jgi:hypothetical protein
VPTYVVTVDEADPPICRVDESLNAAVVAVPQSRAKTGTAPEGPASRPERFVGSSWFVLELIQTALPPDIDGQEFLVGDIDETFYVANVAVGGKPLAVVGDSENPVGIPDEPRFIAQVP